MGEEYWAHMEMRNTYKICQKKKEGHHLGDLRADVDCIPLGQDKVQ
jgi:hypothetical protein